MTNPLSYQIKILNYLQIIRREREFNIEEIKQLCAITEDCSMGEDIPTGAYLLFGNQMAAEIHFEKMELEIQKAYRGYPIFKFWNKIGEEK